MFRSQKIFYFSKSKTVFRNKCIENKKKFTIVNRNTKRQLHTMNNGHDGGPNGPNNEDYLKMFLASVSAYYAVKILFRR